MIHLLHAKNTFGYIYTYTIQCINIILLSNLTKSCTHCKKHCTLNLFNLQALFRTWLYNITHTCWTWIYVCLQWVWIFLFTCACVVDNTFTAFCIYMYCESICLIHWLRPVSIWRMPKRSHSFPLLVWISTLLVHS